MKTNLIYVFADQLRWRSLGYTGDPYARTPYIDQLSRESADLCSAVSGHPVCAPYRATLLTGKYTTSTGMVINEIRLNPDQHSFAHVLRDSGYAVEYIGKWHLYAANLGDHYNPENSFIPPGPHRLGFDGFFAAYNFHHEYYAPQAYYHLDTPQKITVDGYEPDVQTDLAIQRLKILHDQPNPFALFLSLGTPHDPWTPENVPPADYAEFQDVDFPLPPNYLPRNDPHADAWARFERGQRKQLPGWLCVYYAMVANLDRNVGRLTAALRQLGLEQNTLFVFTSDHGELFGAHGRHAKNIFYDEAVRVPFLLKAAGLPPGPRGVCLNTVDIMPSLLSLLGLPIPEAVEGTDLSGRIREADEPAQAPPGVETSLEMEGALMMGTGPTAVWGDGYEWRAYRTRQYTYAVYRCDRQEFLFDNLADPYQLTNLAGDESRAAVREGLKAAMYSKMQAVGDTFEKNSYYRKNWVENRLILRAGARKHG